MNIHTYIYTSMCTIIKTYMLGQCPICKPTRWAQPIMGRLCPIIILMVEVFTMLLGIALRHMLKSNVPAGFAIIFLGMIHLVGCGLCTVVVLAGQNPSHVGCLLPLRRCIASPCPPCLKPFGSRFLRSCLGKFGHTPRSSLCENQQQNSIGLQSAMTDM